VVPRQHISMNESVGVVQLVFQGQRSPRVIAEEKCYCDPRFQAYTCCFRICVPRLPRISRGRAHDGWPSHFTKHT